MNKINNRISKAKIILKNKEFIAKNQNLGGRGSPESLEAWLKRLIAGEWQDSWMNAWNSTESRYDQYIASPSRRRSIKYRCNEDGCEETDPKNFNKDGHGSRRAKCKKHEKESRDRAKMKSFTPYPPSGREKELQ